MTDNASEKINAPSSSWSLKDRFIIPIFLLNLLCIVIMIIGPLGVLGYQCVFWLKHNQWRPLPLSLFGIESWEGLARLPLSLGLFMLGVLGIACFNILMFIVDRVDLDTGDSHLLKR